MYENSVFKTPCSVSGNALGTVTSGIIFCPQLIVADGSPVAKFLDQ